jgi:hypothetical protein
MKLAKVYLDWRCPVCLSRWVASSRRASSRSRCSSENLLIKRLQRGLGWSNSTMPMAPITCPLVAQRNAADHKGAGPVGEQVDQIGLPVSST